MEQHDMSEEEWDQMVQELVSAWRTSRPPHHERRDFEMSGQREILHVLGKNGEETTPGALAKACRVSTARIAKALNQLEEQGIVVRRNDPADGRRTLVSLTDKGRELVEERHRELDGTIKAFLKELGADDTRELVRLLRRIGEIAPRFYAAHCADEQGEGGERR